MFLNIQDSIEYVDPWLSTYEARLRQLTAQKRRIAYYYEYPDTSTFRYRAFNPGLTLAAHPGFGVSAAWFDHRDLASDDVFIDLADALVICRTRYNAAIARMISRARARNIPVIFDCDDLVFDLDRLHVLIDSLNLNQKEDVVWDDWFASIGRIGAVLRLCDSFTTTNEYLAACAKECLPALRTAVVPNYLNRTQQKLSESLYASKRGKFRRRNENIHIGYFSGSPTHVRDFAVAAPAIYRLMEKDARVKLRVVGFLDANQGLTRFGDRIEIYPLQDFLNLQRLIAEVEINIAPLQENTFTNCKSELKFFEAAICGTLTLATPTFTFRNSITHGATGFLVPSYDWDAALQAAVGIVDDESRYDDITRAAFEHARELYGWDRHAETIIGAVFGVDTLENCGNAEGNNGYSDHKVHCHC